MTRPRTLNPHTVMAALGTSHTARLADDAALDDEAALNDAFEDQQRLEPLKAGRGKVTLATLRRVWVGVKGKAALPTVPTLLDAAHTTLQFGCSARDDDNFIVFVVRGNELIDTLWHDDRKPAEVLAAALADAGVQTGDSVLVLHNHICATDCYADAESFLNGVRLG